MKLHKFENRGGWLEQPQAASQADVMMMSVYYDSPMQYFPYSLHLLFMDFSLGDVGLIFLYLKLLLYELFI